MEIRLLELLSNLNTAMDELNEFVKSNPKAKNKLRTGYPFRSSINETTLLIEAWYLDQQNVKKAANKLEYILIGKDAVEIIDNTGALALYDAYELDEVDYDLQQVKSSKLKEVLESLMKSVGTDGYSVISLTEYHLLNGNIPVNDVEVSDIEISLNSKPVSELGSFWYKKDDVYFQTAMLTNGLPDLDENNLFNSAVVDADNLEKAERRIIDTALNISPIIETKMDLVEQTAKVYSTDDDYHLADGNTIVIRFEFDDYPMSPDYVQINGTGVVKANVILESLDKTVNEENYSRYITNFLKENFKTSREESVILDSDFSEDGHFQFSFGVAADAGEADRFES